MSNNSNVAEYRYSAINTMHECKLSAYLIYGLKLKSGTNHYALFGTVLHDVLEEYAKHCIKNKYATDYSEFNNIKFKYLPSLQEYQLEEANNVLEFIKNTFNFENVFNYPIVEIEKRLLVDRDLQPTEDNGYFSSGIDKFIIDGDIALVEDYKSVRAIYTTKFMKESLQRKIYSWMILKHYPQVNEVKFTFNFIRYGYISESYSIYRDELEELEEQIKKEILSLEELLNSKEPPQATPSGYCLLCPMHGRCEEYSNFFTDTEKIKSSQDAINLYKQFAVMKVKIKEIESILKFYIDHNSPIELENEIYGPVVEEATEYPDTLQLIEVLRQLDIPDGAIYDCLKFNKTNISKLLSRFKIPKEKRKKITDLAIITSRTKYKSKRKEEEKTEDEDGSIIDPFI